MRAKKQNIIPVNNSNIAKIYTNPANIIAKNDFGNNFESFENNWGNYDLPTRKEKLRQALISSINEYGDSDLIPRLNELQNPNIDEKTLIEIGNKTGYDYSEFLGKVDNITTTQNTSLNTDDIISFGKIC